MDIKLIQQLKDAGVGSDIILNLILQQPDEATPPEPVPEAPQPAPKPEPAPPTAPASDPVLQKIDQLIGVIQASNIIRTGREAAPPESVDDILAAMITPQKSGGK